MTTARASTNRSSARIEGATFLRARCPAARHEALDGLGHMGPITHPDVVNARIICFLMAQHELVCELAWA
jgi:pimeloyl-ACP methyl ester carboxylesterase